MSADAKKVRWWVWVALAGCLALLALSLAALMSREELEFQSEEGQATDSGAVAPTTHEPPSDSAPGSLARAESEPNRPPPAEEIPFADPDPLDPLMVRLPGRPGLGPISVERYDSEGWPTGEPLRQGTPVQIPDPERPGTRIFFRVP